MIPVAFGGGGGLMSRGLERSRALVPNARSAGMGLGEQLLQVATGSPVHERWRPPRIQFGPETRKANTRIHEQLGEEHHFSNLAPRDPNGQSSYVGRDGEFP